MKVYLLITDGDSIQVTAYATRKQAEDEAANIMRDTLDNETLYAFDQILAEKGYAEAEQVYEDCLVSGSVYVRVDEAEVRG